MSSLATLLNQPGASVQAAREIFHKFEAGLLPKKETDAIIMNWFDQDEDFQKMLNKTIQNEENINFEKAVLALKSQESQIQKNMDYLKNQISHLIQVTKRCKIPAQSMLHGIIISYDKMIDNDADFCNFADLSKSMFKPFVAHQGPVEIKKNLDNSIFRFFIMLAITNNASANVINDLANYFHNVSGFCQQKIHFEKFKQQPFSLLENCLNGQDVNLVKDYDSLHNATFKRDELEKISKFCQEYTKVSEFKSIFSHEFPLYPNLHQDQAFIEMWNFAKLLDGFGNKQIGEIAQKYTGIDIDFNFWKTISYICTEFHQSARLIAEYITTDQIEQIPPGTFWRTVAEIVSRTNEVSFTEISQKAQYPPDFSIQAKNAKEFSVQIKPIDIFADNHQLLINGIEKTICLIDQTGKILKKCGSLKSMLNLLIDGNNIDQLLTLITLVESQDIVKCSNSDDLTRLIKQYNDQWRSTQYNSNQLSWISLFPSFFQSILSGDTLNPSIIFAATGIKDPISTNIYQQIFMKLPLLPTKWKIDQKDPVLQQQHFILNVCTPQVIQITAQILSEYDVASVWGQLLVCRKSTKLIEVENFLNFFEKWNDNGNTIRNFVCTNLNALDNDILHEFERRIKDTLSSQSYFAKLFIIYDQGEHVNSVLSSICSFQLNEVSCRNLFDNYKNRLFYVPPNTKFQSGKTFAILAKISQNPSNYYYHYINVETSTTISDISQQLFKLQDRENLCIHFKIDSQIDASFYHELFKALYFETFTDGTSFPFNIHPQTKFYFEFSGICNFPFITNDFPVFQEIQPISQFTPYQYHIDHGKITKTDLIWIKLAMVAVQSKNHSIEKDSIEIDEKKRNVQFFYNKSQAQSLEDCFATLQEEYQHQNFSRAKLIDLCSLISCCYFHNDDTTPLNYLFENDDKKARMFDISIKSCLQNLCQDMDNTKSDFLFYSDTATRICTFVKPTEETEKNFTIQLTSSLLRHEILGNLQLLFLDTIKGNIQIELLLFILRWEEFTEEWRQEVGNLKIPILLWDSPNLSRVDLCNELKRKGFNCKDPKFLVNNRNIVKSCTSGISVFGQAFFDQLPRGSTYFDLAAKVYADLAKDPVGLLYQISYTPSMLRQLCYLNIRLSSPSQLPTIWVDESGTGKTELAQVFSIFFGSKFMKIVLDRSITQQIISEQIRSQVLNAEENSGQKYVIYFDEFNTAPCQIFLKELMINRLFEQKTLPRNLGFICTANPYRKISSGLASQMNFPKDQLAYRVYKLHESYEPYILKFAQNLNEDIEKALILHLHPIKKKLGDGNWNLILAMNRHSLEQLRRILEDGSQANHRDALRLAKLLCLFYQGSQFLQTLDTDPKSWIFMAFHLTYVVRLDSKMRSAFIQRIAEVQNISVDQNISPTQRKEYENEWNKSVLRIEQLFADSLVIPSHLALNDPLRENLFALYVCIQANISIWIIGVPGASKTTSAHLIMHYLKDIKQQKITCTSSTTKKQIQDKLDQLNGEGVFLIDEIGIGDQSLNDPLACLNSVMDNNPNLVIIGISNHGIDAARLNRGLCINRAQFDPTETIRVLSGDLATPILSAYQERLRFNNKVGLRDVYNFVRIVTTCPNQQSQVNAVRHCFDYINSGTLSRSFMGSLGVSPNTVTVQSRLQIIEELLSPNRNPLLVRPLMIYAVDGDDSPVDILTQKFPNLELILNEGMTEDKQIRNAVNKVILAMKEGRIVMFLKKHLCFPALYDLFSCHIDDNLVWIYLPDADPMQCRVDPKFRIIVLENQRSQYGPEFLDRFEKITINLADINDFPPGPYGSWEYEKDDIDCWHPMNREFMLAMGTTSLAPLSIKPSSFVRKNSLEMYPSFIHSTVPEFLQGILENRPNANAMLPKPLNEWHETGIRAILCVPEIVPLKWDEFGPIAVYSLENGFDPSDRQIDQEEKKLAVYLIQNDSIGKNELLQIFDESSRLNAKNVIILIAANYTKLRLLPTATWPVISLDKCCSDIKLDDCIVPFKKLLQNHLEGKMKPEIIQVVLNALPRLESSCFPTILDDFKLTTEKSILQFAETRIDSRIHEFCSSVERIFLTGQTDFGQEWTDTVTKIGESEVFIQYLNTIHGHYPPIIGYQNQVPCEIGQYLLLLIDPYWNDDLSCLQPNHTLAIALVHGLCPGMVVKDQRKIEEWISIIEKEIFPFYFDTGISDFLSSFDSLLPGIRILTFLHEYIEPITEKYPAAEGFLIGLFKKVITKTDAEVKEKYQKEIDDFRKLWEEEE